ncbi:MAG: hypothetical protein PF437_07700 [Sulfurimonas sp.]|jgi:hypothetical protein|nr:hypothetical protein [Sulfurimonas sp.]
MSYENIPMSALELAVKASKAVKAEYWACDIAIDENIDEPYILECATAFAAFPYVRDWIGQYIMWDLSSGMFRLPHVPLFSWEELGKMNPSVLRTLRHLYFSKYEPSVDGAYWLEDKGNFDMELTDESNLDDVPVSINPPVSEDRLPQMLKEKEEEVASKIEEKSLLNISDVSLTELMTLQGMEEDVAVKIKELFQNKHISTFKELSVYDFTSKEQVSQWAKSFNN